MDDTERAGAQAPGDESDVAPAGPGTRSDQAGSSGSVVGPAPQGGDADAASTPGPADESSLPVGRVGKDAAGERAPGTTDGEAAFPAGDDPQTDWLRGAPEGSADAS
ncbi:MAG TPA: hypothetical protein VD763_12470 [Candidatus Saccharimonadales bacterium]|nr:hypothetical protein [Candidatus Saccharimonadales bacterium]